MSRWSKWALWVLAGIATTWLGVVVYHWGGDLEWTGQFGDSFAPIAALLSIATLVVLFEHRHQDEKREIERRRADALRAHEDAVRAHDDRLAAAYVVWFDKAWRVLHEMLNSFADPTLSRNDIGAHVDLVNRVLVRERDLRLASVPLSMLEHKSEFSDRINKTFVAFRTWERVPVVDADKRPFLEYVDNLKVLVKERLDDVERLFEDAGRSLAVKVPPPPPA